MNLSPTKGREQKGVRPALVVSRRILNATSGLALVIPITSKEKGYPFEVKIEAGKIKGVALVDQVRSIDFKERKLKICARAENSIMSEIRGKMLALIS